MEDGEWVNYIPGWNKFPRCFKAAIPYLLASVVYHDTWLRENLSSSHPLFQTRFFRDGVPNRLREKVLSGNFYCESSRMTATGIPAHHLLTKEFHDFKTCLLTKLGLVEEKVQSSSTDIVKAVEKMSENVDHQLTDLPAAVATDVLGHVVVNGAVPVSASDFARLSAGVTAMGESMRADRASLRHEMAQMLAEAIAEGRRAGPGNDANSDNQRAEARLAAEGTSQLHQWPGGYLRRVPFAFVFRGCSTKAVWDAWWRGDASNRIGPYRFFTNADMPKKTDKVNLARVRMIMKELITTAIQLECIPEQHPETAIAAMRCERQDELFDQVFSSMVRTYPGERRRTGEAAYSTVYNWTTRKRALEAASEVDGDE